MRTDANRILAGRDVSDGRARRGQEGSSPLSLINRRRFLAYTSGCILGAVGGASGAEAKSDKPAKPVDIGSLKDFPKDAISEDFIQYDFFVIRYQDRLFAASSTCTHQGNDLFRDPQDPTRIKCSGHESVFDSEGKVVVGPAFKGLTRLGIALKDAGKVVVSPGRKFSEDQWGEKGSSLPIE